MKRYFLISFSVFAFFILCYSCSENKKAEEVSVNPLFQIPNGWPKPVYNFENNKLTKEGIALGKKLFFDQRLSKDSTISCSSCHKTMYGLVDNGKAFSIGINNLPSERNTPSLFNLAWNKSFMWDGGVNHIEVQPLVPITNPVEMGEDLANVVSKIGRDKEYKKLFKTVFETDSITSQLIFKAFAQYIGTRVSSNSAYDRVMRKETVFKFSEWQQQGYILFQKHCVSCHTEPLFTNYQFKNNGLSLNTEKPDYGRYKITHDPTDSMKFKVPSLRNITFTAPYMHDGRFKDLLEVLDHYAGERPHNSLTDNAIAKMPKFTLEEKKRLIFFLGTLSDFTFKNDPENKK